MRTAVIFLIGFGTWASLFAETLPPSVDLADPSTLLSGQSCIAECEAVHTDCLEQCGGETVRAREEKFDLADAPVSECLKGCQDSLALCERTCK